MAAMRKLKASNGIRHRYVSLLAMVVVIATGVFALRMPAGAVADGGGAAAGAKRQELETSSAPSQRIDSLIEAQLAEQGLEPNAAIDDATFLRRAYLNIGGRIPTIEEAEAFLGDTYPDKRERLIARLLDSDAYVSNFYHFWADLLRINSDLDGAVKAAYELWVKRALRENLAYDEMVRDLVSADGKFWENGATGYYFRDRGMPLDNMSNTVRIFLGTRLECAQCHDHPFDKWTQMDYYEMAAFSFGMSTRNYRSTNRQLVADQMKQRMQAAFVEATGIEGFPAMSAAQLEKALGNPRKRGRFDKLGLNEKQLRRVVAKGAAAAKVVGEEADAMKEVIGELYNPLKYVAVSEQQSAQVKLPHDYQYSDADPHDPVAARTMFGADISPLDFEAEGIEAYAQWMTSKENPTFTKVIVNRLWKEVFGLGVFEPLDEITDQTRVSNPELLAYLETLMRDFDYDIKAFLEVLYNTRSYQRAADASEIVMGEPYYFQGPVLRRMSAEQIWDSVVALALADADRYQPRLKKQLESIDRQRLIFKSLEERSPEEFMAMVEELAPVFGGLRVRLNEMREQMVAAQQAGERDRLQELRREMSRVSKSAKQRVAEVGYIYLDRQVDGDDLIAALGLNEVSSGAMAPSTMAAADEMGSDVRSVVTNLPKVELPDMPEGLDRREKKAWAAEQKGDYSIYRNLIAGMARASELDSPARRGHFLRDFGQSDREVIENAADNASVPQALNLLNGPIVEALTNRFAVFGKRIHEADDGEEKVRMIFQAMLTREPSAEEIALVNAEVENFGDQAYEGIVWALLNTRQFLFIQ